VTGKRKGGISRINFFSGMHREICQDPFLVLPHFRFGLGEKKNLEDLRSEVLRDVSVCNFCTKFQKKINKNFDKNFDKNFNKNFDKNFTKVSTKFSTKLSTKINKTFNKFLRKPRKKKSRNLFFPNPCDSPCSPQTKLQGAKRYLDVLRTRIPVLSDTIKNQDTKPEELLKAKR
jgi:hypothetical protein